MVPPASLMQDCPETYVELKKNRDLVTKIEKLRGDLARCNADKEAMRKWQKELGL